MNVSFSRDTYHTYMVITGDDIPDADYEEIMMGNQQSAVLLPFHMQCINGQKQYYYEITGKVDFRSCIEKRQADLAGLEELIRCLADVCRAVDEYLLNLNAVLISAEYLYVDVEMRQMCVAYVPGMQGDFLEALKELTSCLLEHTNHKDKEGVLLVYDLYRIVRQEDFTPGLLERLLKQQENSRRDERIKIEKQVELNDIEDMKESCVAGEDSKMEEELEELAGKRRFLKIGLLPVCGIVSWLLVLLFYRLGYLQNVMDRAGIGLDARWMVLIMLSGILLVLLLIRLARILEKKIRFSVERKVSEEDIWGDLEPGISENTGIYAFTDMSAPEADQTVVLSDVTGTIRMISLNKDIAGDLVITKFPCIVGSRQPDAAVIISVIGISRKHAMIERLEDGIYLSDLHSTNGTFVNGERLKENEKRKLKDEDMVTFADVRYMYCGGEFFDR